MENPFSGVNPLCPRISTTFRQHDQFSAIWNDRSEAFGCSTLSMKMVDVRSRANFFLRAQKTEITDEELSGALPDANRYSQHFH